MNKIRIEAAALVVGLSLFLFSCEKEVSGRGSGRKVTINFAVSNEGYGADQEILKGAGAKDLEGETVYIPLSDNYFMAATLVPEPAEELRAPAAFELGQKIYFAVYAISGTSPLDEAVYEWNGSKFVPDGEPLGVDADGTNYHFVAYSFFGDPTEEPYEADIEPWQDLVWGEKDQEVYDTELTRTVSISMKHKFSRVRVKVDASSITDAKVIDIDDVVIEGGEEADLTVKTGVVAPTGTAVTETLENWTSEDGGKAMLSGYKVFYPSLTTISVGSLDLEIDEDPLALTNKSVTFSQALAAGVNYTVVVDVRTNRWAWSNIYWVATSATAGYMTFDRTLVDVGHQYYQGIFFKWGSLVGSSYGSHLYIPDNVASRTWVGPKNISETSWTIFNDIPYNGDYASTTGSYLYQHPNFSSYLGDICNYIDDDWRMPGIAEMTATTLPEHWGYMTDYVWVSGSNVSYNADGTGIITLGGAHSDSSGFVFFPASGFINGYSNVFMTGTGMYYSSGSPNTELNNTLSCCWGITAYTLTLTDNFPRRQMHPIRCIRKLPAD